MRENRTTYRGWSSAALAGKVIAIFLGLLLWLAAPLAGQVGGQPGSLTDLHERAIAAGIEESRLVELVERGAARQLGEGELVQMLTPAVEMAEQGLPGEMVIQKAMEGMAKGIPPAMMNRVLTQIQQGAEQSVPMVDRWLQRPDVVQMLERSGAGGDRSRFRRDMLRMGARANLGSAGASSVDDILTALSEPMLLERASPSQIVAAATIMSDLPSSTGLPLPDASQIVARAVQNGFSSSELQRLPAAMNMAQRRSQLPAASIVTGVGDQMDRGIPAADILQNLFNGEVGGGPPGHTPAGLESRPDRDENHPGRGVSGPPGQGPPVTPPGQSDDGPPGQGGTPPGLDGDGPGNGGGPPNEPPGQGNDGPPGQDGTPPGQGGTPPGQGNDGPPNGPPTSPPGQGNDGPPNEPPGQGNDGPPNGPPNEPPGQGGTPPNLDGDGPGNRGGSPNRPPSQADDGPPNGPPGENGIPGNGRGRGR